MQTCFSVIIAVLFAFGTTVFARAQQTSPSSVSINSNTQETDLIQGQGKSKTEFLLLAIVRKIDRTSGLVSLDTEIGLLKALAAPDVLQELQEGDVITIAVTEESSEQVSI